MLNNKETGLGSLDESGLEGNNKILRSIRTNLSRKNSQNSNLEDTLHRMWISSDPQVNCERSRSKPFCKYCKERGHSTRYCKKKNMKETVLAEEDAIFNMLNTVF